MTFEYTLARPSYLAMLRQYNEKICGMSILGTVLETAGETLKIHLDIDPTQDPATAYPYDWVPGTGNLMYLMPKIGTRVSLYFYSSDERSARAIGCVRTNGGDQCTEMEDYNKRYLTTEHNKQLYLFPDMMGLVGTSNTDTPLHIQMHDVEGITIQSHNKLNILAKDGITMQAKAFHMQAMTELMVTHADLSLEGDGTETPYSLVARPNASMNMSCGLTTFQGKNTKFAGWTYDNFEPFSDAPGKGKKKINWKLVGKVALGIVGAIAVGVVVGAIVAGTGGAAAVAALPVLAKIGITAKGIGIAGGAITALAGGAASVKKGIDESKSGEEYGAWDYLANSLGVSLRTGAVVLTTITAIAYLPAASLAAGYQTGIWFGARTMPLAIKAAKIGGSGTIGFFSLSHLSDVYHSIFGKNPMLDTLFKGNEDAYRTVQFASNIGTAGIIKVGMENQYLLEAAKQEHNQEHNNEKPPEISEADKAKLDKWKYRPDDNLYLENKKIFDNSKYFNQETGKIIWPENDGFLNEPVRETLEPGTRIDRYGTGGGYYTSPEGTSFEERSIVPGAGPYKSYEVVKPVEVWSGETAPWFDQDGGGTQYKFDMTIDELILEGIIE